MRRFVLALGVLVFSAALVGCGGDSGKITIADAATPTTDAEAADEPSAGGDAESVLRAWVFPEDGSEMAEDQGECFIEQVLGALNEDSLTALADNGVLDTASLTDDERPVIVDALDQCVDPDEVLAGFAEGLTADGELSLTDDEATCATETLASSFASIGDLIVSMDASTEDESGVLLFEALGPCLSEESTAAFVSSLLVSEDLDQATADCVTAGLIAEFGSQGLLKEFAASATSEGSQTLEDATALVSTTCLAGGAPSEVPVDGSITVPDIGSGIGG